METNTELVYEEINAELRRQEEQLTEVRKRAVEILGLGTAAVGFLVTKDSTRVGLTAVALALLVLATIVTLKTLTPRPGWRFNHDAQILVDHYLDSELPFEDVFRQFTANMRDWSVGNAENLGALYRLLRWDIGLVALSVALLVLGEVL